MKLTKMLSALVAAAALSSSVCMLNVSAESEMPADTLAVANIYGMLGSHVNYGEGDSSNAGEYTLSPAYINGNAQYQTSITFDDFGTNAEGMQEVWIQINGVGEDAAFTADRYPDLKITVDEILADGVPIEFTDNEAAHNLKFYDGANPGGSVRLFLVDKWGLQKADVGGAVNVEYVYTVRFTVSGLYNEGTSNVTDIDVPDKPEVLLGDVNGDTVIDAKDASAVLAEYASRATGAASTFDDAQNQAADVDGDTVVDAKDASKILAYYAAKATGGNPSWE
ncbi:MAG: dockerin type I domain-containing protein [Oscillospiraceae bacterium]|nr:dockerin type I domain-containing protein [Oscillospiraceae bacterium]